MRQSRLMSLVEAVANVVVGFGAAIATQIAVFPMLGLQGSLGQNAQQALIFTCVSIVQSYLLRRAFEVSEVAGWFVSETPRREFHRDLAL